MSIQAFSKLKFRAAAAGQGLVLVLVFMFSAVVVLASFQFMSTTSAPVLLKADNQNISLKGAADYAMSQVQLDVVWLINYYGSPPTTGWTDPWGPYVVNPQDNPACNTFNCPTPSAPITGTGTVTAANGYSYTLQVTVTNGTTSFTKTQTYYLNPFSCNGVENTIHEGQTGTLADNKLIRYAQQGCPKNMHYYGWGWTQGATAGAGTSGGNCTTNPVSYNSTEVPYNYTASGLLDLANASSSCLMNVNLTNTYSFYQDVRFGTLKRGTINLYSSVQRTVEIDALDASQAASNNITMKVKTFDRNSVAGEQDVYITSMVSDSVNNRTSTLDATGSVAPATFIINSMSGNNTITGTSSNVGSGDLYNLYGPLPTGGTITMSGGGNTLFLDGGLTGGTISMRANNSYWWGSNVTVNGMTGGTITTGGGWDNIVCGQAFSGDVNPCTTVTNVTIEPAYLDATHLQDNGGGDTVYLNAAPGAGTLVKMGNSGGNIVYIPGQTSGTINLGSGNNNVVIIDGNRTGGTLTCTGTTNNIILLKNGAAIGAGVTGFNRTINY